MAAEGWSLSDVQVALPVSAVMSEMHRHAHMPLLYLGHPVGVVQDEKGAGGGIGVQGAGTGERRLRQVLPQGAEGARPRRDTPNGALRTVKYRMRDSGCRALMVSC